MSEQLKAQQRAGHQKEEQVHQKQAHAALDRPSWTKCQQALAESRYYDALLEAHFLKKVLLSLQEGAPNGVDTELDAAELDNVILVASEKCPALAHQLFQTVITTQCYEYFWSAVTMLAQLKAYAVLVKCLAVDKVIDSGFFIVSSDAFIISVLYECSDASKKSMIDKKQIHDAHVIRIQTNKHFVEYRRNPVGINTRFFSPDQRYGDGEALWAVVFDPQTQCYVASNSDRDTIDLFERNSGQHKERIISPKSGVRGLRIDEQRRIGFFNAELGHTFYAFNLDSGEIIKSLSGPFVRPERIRSHKPTHTLVTGNLGLRPLDIKSYCQHAQTVSSSMAQENEKSMVLINAERCELIMQLPTGRRPTAVNISEKYVAAGNYQDNSVTIYERSALCEGKALTSGKTVMLDYLPSLTVSAQVQDTQNHQTFQIKHQLNQRLVEGIAILDGRDWVLVSGFDACFVAVIDIALGRVIKVIPVQDRPYDVAVNDDETRAYVCCHDSDEVVVVDLDRCTPLYSLSTGPQPVDITLNSDELLVPHTEGFDRFDLKRIEEAFLQDQGFLTKSFSCSAEACLAEEDHLPVPLKLNLAALHYIAGVDPKVRWKAWGTRGQHLEGVPWAVERERKEPYFITRGLNRRGGKEALDEYREECKTLMHAFLTGQREVTEQYTHTKRFFFVCGIMRSGGTYLFKELNRKLEIDYTQRNFLMSHDSIPQFHLMAHHNNPIFQMPLLYEMCQFLVWAKRECGDYVVQKRIAASLAIPYLHAIFGEAADYFITLRHPGMAATSFAEMEHITEDAQAQSPAGWKSIVMPQMKGQIECWDGLTYREQFLYFWQVYYKQIIRPGVAKARIHPVVYGDEMAQAVNRFCPYGCADYQPSAFKPREKTIDDFWQSDAVTHAVEDMIQCWSDGGYAINALMTPV